MADEFFIPELNFDSPGKDSGVVIPQLNFGDQNSEFEIPDLDFSRLDFGKREENEPKEELTIPEDLDLSSLKINHFQIPSVNNQVKLSNDDDRISFSFPDVKSAQDRVNIPKIDLSSAFIHDRCSPGKTSAAQQKGEQSSSSSKNPFTTILLVQSIPLSANWPSTKPSPFGTVLRRNFFHSNKGKCSIPSLPNQNRSTSTPLISFKFDTPSPDDEVIKAQKKFNDILK